MSTIYLKSESVEKWWILREIQDLVEMFLLKIAELSKEVLVSLKLYVRYLSVVNTEIRNVAIMADNMIPPDQIMTVGVTGDCGGVLEEIEGKS